MTLMEELKEVFEDHNQPCGCNRCSIYRENNYKDFHNRLLYRENENE